MFSTYDYYYYASSDDMPDYPPIPKWIFAVAAFNLFMAYTLGKSKKKKCVFRLNIIIKFVILLLDGIDGKQARRTQTSGPLGELFDHGLDSWTAVLITTCMFSVFGRTDFSVSPTRMYFILWNVFITFYLSHWEKYNTGVLFLPWGYDASMVATILVFILASIGGHTLFKFSLNKNISSGMIFEMILYVSALVSSLPVVLWNIFK